jgi:predicted metal-dependent phosphoesterase TrpH
MQLKANLHLHTSEDPEDGSFIPYSAKEAVSYAASHGFSVLAFTLHNRFYYTEELQAHAASHGVLLVPGIEKTIEGRHVLILNVTAAAEALETFSDLEQYRRANPEALTIAAHPYFYGAISVKEHLDRRPELFDALEQSWFYKGIFNRNKKGARAAMKYQKPFIATSDTHVLSRIENSFALIEAPEKTLSAVLSAIRAGSFKNVSRPASLAECLSQIWMTIKHPGGLFAHPSVERASSAEAHTASSAS